MRKIIIVEFISLDGVIQAPGAPGEDTSGEFKFGGWLVPLADETLNEALSITYAKPYDLLLGRKTYDIFAAYWPEVAEDRKFASEFNACTKYVATHSPETLKWENSEALGADLIQKLQTLKNSGDKNLLVVGSSNFAHTLFNNNLVDEIHLFIAPIILGKGKRLYDDNSKPSSFKLTRSAISKTGMVCANYSRAGEIKTGSFD